MSTIVKLGIVGAVVGAVIYFVVVNAKRFANEFSLKIVAYGKPELRNTQLTVPLRVRYDNPTPVAINVDRLLADIYIDKNGSWIKAGQIDQPVEVAPNESDGIVYPKLDLAVLGGNLLDTLNAVLIALNSKSLRLRTDVTATYAGITLPTQTFVDTVAL